MAIDIAIPRSRRSLMAGAVGGVAATLAATMAGAQRVLGAGDDGAIIHVGERFLDVQTETNLTNNTNDQPAFRGSNDQDGIGVQGATLGGIGVHALAVNEFGATIGVLGEARSPGGVGVRGKNDAGSGPAQGVRGTTDSPRGWATVGLAGKGGTGVVGASGANVPDSAIPRRTGVVGYAEIGRGGVFRGTTAQVRLVPTGATSHPSSGARGDLYVDNNGRLWFCKGGTTWVRLA